MRLSNLLSRFVWLIQVAGLLKRSASFLTTKDRRIAPRSTTSWKGLITHRTSLVRGVSRSSFDSASAKRSYFDEELSTKSKEALRADTAAEPESGDETLRMNFRLEEIANEITSTVNLDRKVKLAAKALAMVRSAKDPDSVSYNTLLKVLAKTSPLLIHEQPAAFLAKRILERMKELHEHQRRANREWYDKALVPPEATEVASIAVAHGPPIVRIKPNVRSYATVMDAFARMATRAAALQTEQLLNDLEQRWRDNDRDFALEPNEVIYNTILTAWAKAGDADECQNWLDRIEAPSTYNYNAVLTALAKSNKALQAESLLRNMKAPPNNRSYCACIDAWARLGIPDKAHALLLELIDLYHNSGRQRDLEPNAVAYSSLIQAYVRSDRVDKVAQAQQVLADMQTAGIKPNSWTYNTLLNCYASSALTGDDESPSEKLRRIKAIYREQLAAGNESTRTFGTVIKACEHLLLWEIDPDFCVSVFQDAVDRGLVSSWVLRQFYGAVPVEVFRRLVQIKDYKEWELLPDEWTRRARQEE